ncbi:hypothetical protein MMC16_003174 [Acarospora aff. strigata]|nr:hypothetical protein [Acarospora aff. strigata]
MGNICGKASKDSDPFSQPGRTLGSAPPPRPANARSTIPSNVNSPGRTLGGPARGDTEDARRAAAQAAEERAARLNQPKGKLGSQLAKERQQTRTTTLGQASTEERRARDADASAEARNWN